MELKKNGMTIQVDDAQVVDLVLERLSAKHSPRVINGNVVPRIGEAWPDQGGIYAGVMRGRDGAPDYHLIVGPESEEMTWDDAKTWAREREQDGHDDFTLPFRAEQALQFANVPELFRKEYYWSSEQHADGSSSAWVQGVVNGSQVWSRQSDSYRARVVRRLDIR